MSVLATDSNNSDAMTQAKCPSSAFTDEQWATAVATSMFFCDLSKKEQMGIVPLMKANFDVDNSGDNRTSGTETPRNYVDRLGREMSPLHLAINATQQRPRPQN